MALCSWRGTAIAVLFPTMVEWLLSWEVSSWIVGVTIAIALAVLAFEDFELAKAFFLVAAADASGGVVMWGTKSRLPTLQLSLLVFILMGIVGALCVLSLRYVDHKRELKKPSITSKSFPPSGPSSLPDKPSLLFVIGAPLGDNQSGKWIMLVRHYGPSRAYGCNIEFFDRDRKNVEHEWLVKHPDTPFLPAGMFDTSQLVIPIGEGGPEPSTVSNFAWTPLDPNRQHYSANITCRDGYFVESWEVTRVDGVLRTKVVIERGPQWTQDNPTLSPVVFHCQDPEFVPQPLLSEIPKNHAKAVHPGWKPNHTFQVPSAIIDPNGHVQVLSGVKAADGGTITNFGCWSLLTKHFGDKG